MKRNSFWPTRQGDQIVWLGNFYTKLPTHSLALDLNTDQLKAGLADAGWLLFILETWLPAVRAWNLGCTNASNDAQTGDGSALSVLPGFTPPVPPAGVLAVNTGALTRLFALVQLIKDGGKCTPAISADLGIVGSVQPGPDLSAVQPVLATTLSGNQVNVKWGWGGNVAWLDSCEIQVDRGDGKGFTLLTIDTTPGYTDTQPLPAARTVWIYRAIYRVADNQVGVWSQPVSAAVPA